MLKTVAFILFALTLVSANPQLTVNQTEEWFHGQKVDHFNPQDNRTYSQRFFMINRYFDSSDSNSPVILYICGEYTCTGLPDDRLFAAQLAEQYKALILIVEHRYYGKSSPLSDLSVENLKYLTVAQALEDLGFFIHWAQNNETLKIGPSRKWISYGGSYPGALSAWFRYKYPHLTAGAVASSSIVNAILDFDELDHQVYHSLMKSSQNCVIAMQEINNYIDNTLDSSESAAQKLKEEYGCAMLPNDEFLYLFADSIAMTVQYGGRTKLCKLLEAPTFEERYQNIKPLITNIPRDYGSSYLKNTTIDPINGWARQWTWQYCSEIGGFNTNYKDPKQSMRSPKLNLTFYYAFCERVFGIPLKPNVAEFNSVYGGLDLNVKNLVIVNGGEDTWQGLSLLVNKGDVLSYYVDCENCAHCVDMNTPSSNDSWALWWTRTKIYYNFDRWINGWI